MLNFGAATVLIIKNQPVKLLMLLWIEIQQKTLKQYVYER